MNMQSILISSVLQVIIFSAVPVVWWAATARKENSFFQWIGLKKPIYANKRHLIIVLGAAVLVSVLMQLIIPRLVEMDTTAVSPFIDQGFAALVPALIFSFVTTGLSEEILFRGFLGKRLIAQHGFSTGNFVQALIFGMIHGVLSMGRVRIFPALLLVLITGAAGWVMGYVNERLAGGSIVPSWLIHGIANMISALMVMF